MLQAVLVEKEAYLLGLCRYVVLNPVRAGLVRHPRQWRWSSYRATAGEQAVPQALELVPNERPRGSEPIVRRPEISMKGRPFCEHATRQDPGLRWG